MDKLSITCPTLPCFVAHHNQTTCATSVMLRPPEGGQQTSDKHFLQSQFKWLSKKLTLRVVQLTLLTSGVGFSLHP